MTVRKGHPRCPDSIFPKERAYREHLVVPIFIAVEIKTETVAASSFNQRRGGGNAIVQIDGIGNLVPLVNSLEIERVTRVFQFHVPLYFPTGHYIRRLTSPGSLMYTEVVQNTDILAFVRLTEQIWHAIREEDVVMYINQMPYCQPGIIIGLRGFLEAPR